MDKISLFYDLLTIDIIRVAGHIRNFTGPYMAPVP